MELAPTAYVVLGMLNLGARTGYDVKGAVDKSTRFFWNASYGQIYPELSRLEEAGLVTGKLAPTGGRKRKEYELTAAGRKALVDWAASPADMPILRDESLLKLFFADALSREEALEQLRMRRSGHEEFLAFLKQLDSESSGAQPFANLVLQYGIEYAEFNLDWCNRWEQRLSEKEAA
jgi:DNA-binding PadR family transcriptional regulator